MSDQIAESPGRGAKGIGLVRYHDEADGSYSMAVASHLYEWSTADLAWIKVTGTSAGAINTSSSGSSSGGGVVTQGARDATAQNWQIQGNVGASISNAPSVTVTSGSITVTNASFGLTGGNVGASVSNAPSVTVTSGSITVTNASFGLTGGNVGASISNAPSVTVTSGSIAVSNALTKGTQATVGLSVQPLRDAGRSYVALTASSVTGSASEALVSFARVQQGVSAAASTSYTVTTGKTLRLQAMSFSVRENAAAIGGLVLRIRHKKAGTTVALTDPVVFLLPEIRTAAATANLSADEVISFPDGIELASTDTVGVTQVASSTTCNLMVTLHGFEY